MAIPKYQFLDEAGVNTLVESMFSKMNDHIRERILAKVGPISSSELDSVIDGAIDESAVDNRLIPTGIPYVEPIVVLPNETLSSISLGNCLDCNDEQVPGTFNWVTTDEEFVNTVDPSNPTDIVLPIEDKEYIVAGIAPTVWEFTPEDTNTYAPVVGELAVAAVIDPNIPVSINVKTPPNNTEYVTGENFNPTGMELEVTYADGHTKIITEGYTIIDGNNLSIDRNDITIKYTENGVTLTCKVNIEVFTAFTVTKLNRDKVGYTNETTDLVIPSTFTDTDGTKYKVTSIGNYAFNYCKNITSITIPDGVTSIGDYAFSSCSNLTSVTISDSVTIINKYTFSDCTGLTSINVNPNNPNYKSIDGILYNKYESIIIKYPIGKSNTTFDIPDSVTSISNEAFQNCTSLTSITIPEGVTSIGNNAFFSCKNITNVTIPNSVTSIGDSAFCNCSKLTSIIIPDTVTNIGSSAFSGSTPWLTNKQNENPLVVVGNGILYDGTTCTGDVIIPDGVISIGNNAFYNCTSLTSITIPDSVTSIDRNAFSNCTSLTSVTIPNSVTTIGYNAFSKVPHIEYNGTATGSPWGALAIN